MASITNDVIDVLVKLGMLQANGSGGVVPGLRKITDASGNTVLVMDGVEYAALPVVAPDLVAANVNLRTDTRANLMALAGGTSEIGYDPATKSLVMFNGVLGEAQVSGREAIVARLIAPISSTTANADNTTPTAVAFNLTGAFYNNDGLIDDGTSLSEILIPAGINVTSVRIQGHLRFAAGTGIARRLRVEGWNGSAWVTATMPVVDFGNPTSVSVNAGNTAQIVYASLNIIAHFYLQVTPFTKLRLVVLADAAVALTTMSSGSPIMVELFAGIKTAT